MLKKLIQFNRKISISRICEKLMVIYGLISLQRGDVCRVGLVLEGRIESEIKVQSIKSDGIDKCVIVSKCIINMFITNCNEVGHTEHESSSILMIRFFNRYIRWRFFSSLLEWA